ncbi:MAG: putative protease [Nevskia sp.]|nr:putative protease [Nevskia sp.]
MQKKIEGLGKRGLRWQQMLPLTLLFGAATVQATPGWLTKASVPSPQNATLRNTLAAGEPVQVTVSLLVRNKSELDGFVSELIRPGSPAYGRALSSAQFLNRYAPTDAQAQAVASHLRSAGFSNVQIAPNRLLVTADGSAGSVRNAFRTALARFDLSDGRSGIANTDAVEVPQALDGIVQAVLGLQTLEQFHTLAVRAEAQPAPLVGTFATPAAKGFNPTAFPLAYGVGSTPNAASTTVGIIAEGSLTQTVTDLRTFETANALPAIPVSIVQVGASSTDTSGVDEWNLDSQDIQAMAGGSLASMIFYDTTSLSNANITAAYNKAVVDNVAKVINVSLGECETSAQGDGTVAADDQIFQTAVAQGQTFSVSTGDSGSHECSVLLKTRSNAKQSYPATSPYVVAVGGTSLYTNTDGSYNSETAWSGGGGGPSVVESKPSYQGSIVSGSMRGVPDISLDADPNTGAIITVKGKPVQVGGTSLSSPLFVGLFARLQSANGNALVFPNPAFYQYIPSHANLVHDVTSGSNGGINPYTAAAGWDFTTGFGSPIVANLASFVASTPGF